VFPWLALILVVCILVQVYFAGAGLLANRSMAPHTTFVHFFEFLPLLMILCAAVGRSGHFAIWGSVGVFVLIEIQYPLIKAPGLVPAFHPVNALLIFALAVMLAHHRPLWHRRSYPRAM
jgi:hypothetical protein